MPHEAELPEMATGIELRHLLAADVHWGLALGDDVEADLAHLPFDDDGRPRQKRLLRDVLGELLELALIETAQDRGRP
jgi:hypothetical protein